MKEFIPVAARDLTDDELDDIAKRLANTKAYRIPDKNGGKYFHKQRIKEDALRIAIIGGIIVMAAGWIGHEAISAWNRRDDKLNVVIEGMVMIMEGNKTVEENQMKLVPRININTKFIHDHMAKDLPTPDDLDLDMYWQTGKISEFMEKVGKVERKR